MESEVTGLKKFLHEMGKIFPRQIERFQDARRSNRKGREQQTEKQTFEYATVIPLRSLVAIVIDETIEKNRYRADIKAKIRSQHFHIGHFKKPQKGLFSEKII